jgi:arsenate reductase-like glutaredoxin family protein
MAPSGGGKTYGALRLATGMAQEMKKITGKDTKILMGNTEKARGRYYANEFAYDIVDIDPPHNPEKYVEFINFAVEEGYDILILDSTSHEWEGKGGCLELHQQAGGTYQSWAKVTPRHEKFIEAIANAPLHIIATMRGKDQYEMTKDDKGKASVQKLGVGAKQRDGFEYEFTCTFLIDQKTSMAESQKDNTHIFENDVATLLSEEHGRKIIQWANTSKVEPKKFEPAKAEPDASELEGIIAKIDAAAKAVGEKHGKDKVVEIIKNHHTTANYKSIKDINKAKGLLKELEDNDNESGSA